MINNKHSKLLISKITFENNNADVFQTKLKNKIYVSQNCFKTESGIFHLIQIFLLILIVNFLNRLLYV